VGIEERLQRLEAAKPDLCEQRPCREPIAMTQKRLMPDGSVEVSGEPPPPLCDTCPEHNNPKAGIRQLEVRWGFEAGGDIGEVVDTESTPGEGITIINVVHDDPRGVEGLRRDGQAKPGAPILAVEGR
jgi:hypothetical protein